MQRGLGGFPHERLHQDKEDWELPVVKANTYYWQMLKI